MLEKYFILAVFLVGSVVFSAIAIILSRLLQPRRKAKYKNEIYECGIPTSGTSWVHYRAGYLFYAVLFIVFDVETVFLYPWAAAYGRLGIFGFVEMVVFILILLAALVYACREGVFKWM